MLSGKHGHHDAESELPLSKGSLRQRLGLWRVFKSRTAERDLHHRIREGLRELGVQPPLDVEELCRALGRKRGRPIVLKPAPLTPPGPSGLWLDTPGVDFILYQQETSRLHQEHIILHEVGHILVSGDGDADGPEQQVDDFVDDWSALIPSLDPKLIRRVARRCSYDDGEECSVELVATIVLEWSSVLNRAAPLAQDPVLRRIQSTLGDRRGWL